MKVKELVSCMTPDTVFEYHNIDNGKIITKDDNIWIDESEVKSIYNTQRLCIVYIDPKKIRLRIQFNKVKYLFNDDKCIYHFIIEEENYTKIDRNTTDDTIDIFDNYYIDKINYVNRGIIEVFLTQNKIL